MKVWIIGVLFVVVNNCASSNVPFRQLDRNFQSGEIRRQKRSTREADYVQKIDIKRSSIEQDDLVAKSPKQMSNMKVDADGDIANKILIKDSDLSGSIGILIIQSRSSPSVPLVFAVRSALGNTKNKKYLQMQIFDDSNNDNEYFEDLSHTDGVTGDDFEDSSENYEGDDQIHFKDSFAAQIEESVVKPQKPSNGKKIIMQMFGQLENENRDKNNKRNTNQSLINLKKKYDKNDLSSVNCIIIVQDQELHPIVNKAASAGLLGADSGGRFLNKRYGLRKRFRG